MAATLSTVTIVSSNPLYPENKVDVTVDNDLSLGTTVVVPNTTFPYIVEFINCPAAYGKRYISDRLFKKLTDPLIGDYSTNKGKIFSTLQKGLSIYPYLTLDYEIFNNQVKVEKEKIKNERDKNIPELDYYGAEIENFENLSPEFLLKWLDLPTTDSSGNPIKKFPTLLTYRLKKDLLVNIDLIDRKNRNDFFSTRYFVRVTYPEKDVTTVSNEDAYNNHNNNDDSTSTKQNKFNNIKSKSRKKTLDSILDSAGKISASILGVGSLVSAASALKNKLSKGLPPKPTLPQKPSINFSDRLVKRKVKKAEQKERKRKKLSNKKTKPAIPETEIKNPSIENLKNKAGGLKNIAGNAKQAAINKQNAVKANLVGAATGAISNVTSYIVTTTINGDTIFVNVANNFGKPSITIQYSAITFTPELAKTAIQFELDNFGIFDKENGFYPKTGSPKPI